MWIRPAQGADIAALMDIRAAVVENRLLDPARVARADYQLFLTLSTLWLCEIGGQVAGFAASDPRDGSIWALFVAPGHEGAGCGQALLARVCADLRQAGWNEAWLTTEAGTRAERFYRRNGWLPRGVSADGDLIFRRALI